MSRFREGDTYLQVRPDSRGYGLKLKVVKATQRRPAQLEPECVLVKVRLRLPVAAFQPLEPEAVVTVPEELVQQPVLVEAVSPE